MTFRLRSIFFIIVSVLLSLLVFFQLTRTLIQSTFDDLEHQTVITNTNRFLSAINDSILTLDKATVDYAFWDDTLQFVGGNYPEYPDDSITSSTYETYSLDFALFYTPSRYYYGAVYDDATGEVIEPPANLIGSVSEFVSSANLTTVDSKAVGIMQLPYGPALIAARPILNNDANGPVAGVLVMGQYLDEEFIRQYASQLDLTASIFEVDDPELAPDLTKALESITDDMPISTSSHGTLASGYALLSDLDGQPALLVRVDTPREIFSRGLTGQRTLIIFFGVLGFVLVLIMVGLLYWSVNRPLQKLTRNVKEIHQQGDFSQRIPEKGKDVMGKLVGEINNLFVDMESANQTITQNSGFEQNTNQMRMIQQFFQDLSNMQELDEVIEEIIKLFGERLGLYYVGVFMVDESRMNAILRGGTANTVPIGFRVAVGSSSTVGASILRGQIQRADIGSRKDSPSFTRLPMARTEIAIPIRYRSTVYGAIALQSSQPETFIRSDEQIMLQKIADYVGGVVDRIFQLEKLETDYHNLEELHNQYLTERWVEELRLQDVLSATYRPKGSYYQRDDFNRLELPLMLHGVRIGKVEIDSDRKTWSQDERAFIDALLLQAVQALENARLLERSQRRAAQERLVADIIRSVRSSSDIETILSTSVLELGRSLRASQADVRIQPNAGDILLQTMEAITSQKSSAPDHPSNNGHKEQDIAVLPEAEDEDDNSQEDTA